MYCYNFSLSWKPTQLYDTQVYTNCFPLPPTRICTNYSSVSYSTPKSCKTRANNEQLENSQYHIKGEPCKIEIQWEKKKTKSNHQRTITRAKSNDTKEKKSNAGWLREKQIQTQQALNITEPNKNSVIAWGWVQNSECKAERGRSGVVKEVGVWVLREKQKIESSRKIRRLGCTEKQRGETKHWWATE